MDLTRLIEAAAAALGGAERLRTIRTYRAEAIRQPAGGGPAAELRVWRAAGGRIRVEETEPGAGSRAWVVDGDSGVLVSRALPANPPRRFPLWAEDVAEIRREARLAPRNVLAHAHELDLAGGEAAHAPDGSPAVALELRPEGVRYYFHPQSFLCVAMVDAARDRRVEYAEYRKVGGVLTPFEERHAIVGRPSDAHAVEYDVVAYDEELPADLFSLEA